MDSKCRNLTANWVREMYEEDKSVEVCGFNEKFLKEGKETKLNGVYTLNEIKKLGKEKGWCPYFYSRHLINFADLVIYNFQYMLNPKIYEIISKQFDQNSIVVFDEAHNIDNVCIEVLSYHLTSTDLEIAKKNIDSLSSKLE